MIAWHFSLVGPLFSQSFGCPCISDMLGMFSGPKSKSRIHRRELCCVYVVCVSTSMWIRSSVVWLSAAALIFVFNAKSICVYLGKSLLNLLT